MSDTGVHELLLRGTCVEIRGLGVLLRGESGAGKSDLALRLIEGGAGLVADDYVLARREGDEIRMAPPPAIAGLLEIRGVGIVRLPHVGDIKLALLVDLVPSSAVVRLPPAQTAEILGLALPLLALNAFEASTPVKIGAWIRAMIERGFHPEASP